jgi:FixJ family two-component response regulator
MVGMYGGFVNQTVPNPGNSAETARPRPEILIVDDSEAITRGLSGLFRTGGFEPVAFAEGLVAIDFALRHKPAAALIDIHLPDISGLVLSQRLREILGSDAPIVVLSGDGSMEVLNSLQHVGATHFFLKPVNASLLLDHFRGYFPPLPSQT